MVKLWRTLFPKYPAGYPYHHMFVDVVGALIVSFFIAALPATPIMIIGSLVDDKPPLWPVLLFMSLTILPAYSAIRRQQ